MILNPRTGHISPQYHVVFDDNFSTVSSLAENEEPPSFWNEVDLDGMIHKIPLDDSITHLDDDRLTPTELQEKERYNLRSAEIRKTYLPPQSSSPLSSSIPTKSITPLKSVDQDLRTPEKQNKSTLNESPVPSNYQQPSPTATTPRQQHQDPVVQSPLTKTYEPTSPISKPVPHESTSVTPIPRRSRRLQG